MIMIIAADSDQISRMEPMPTITQIITEPTITVTAVTIATTVVITVVILIIMVMTTAIPITPTMVVVEMQTLLTRLTIIKFYILQRTKFCCRIFFMSEESCRWSDQPQAESPTSRIHSCTKKSTVPPNLRLWISYYFSVI